MVVTVFFVLCYLHNNVSGNGLKCYIYDFGVTCVVVYNVLIFWP